MEVQRQSDPMLRYVESAQAVERSVTVQGGPIVAPTLDRRFTPQNTLLIKEGETEDGQSVFRVVLYKLRDELTASREGLVAVSKRHIELKRGVTKLSNERMSRFKQMADDYTWLRGRLKKQVGSFDTDVLAGFQGPTATRSAALLFQLELAADALSVAELSEDRLGAFDFNPQQTAEKLRAKVRQYRELLEELEDLKREVEVSQKEKDRTVERHKRTFYPIARTIEDFYRLAGEDELAAKVRPSEVRRGRRAIEVEDSPEGEAETETETEGLADGASPAEPSPSPVTASSPPEGAGDGASPEGDPPASTAATSTDAGSSDV